jgi:predicted alpha/beta hydrolase
MTALETAAAADGYALAVARYPARGPAWATMLVAPAMGVRQDFYEPVARFFARNGVHVLTFDYRGMGASRRGSLRALDADVVDWAARDLDAMLAEAQRADERLPLVLLGHSLGGQILGIAPSNGRVRASLNVTAGSGYYRFNERMRLRVRFLWFVAIPLATRLAGYFPGRALGMIGDLPRGVALQWRRWCLHPEYLLAEGEAARAAFERVRCPILSLSFADDEMLPKSAIESLNGFYRNARLEHRHLAPADAGARRVGHFGFFSERHGARLWAESLAWLRGALGGAAA